MEDPRDAPDPKLNRSYGVGCPQCNAHPRERCYDRRVPGGRMIGYTHMAREASARELVDKLSEEVELFMSDWNTKMESMWRLQA